MSLQFAPILRHAFLDAIAAVVGAQPHLDLWTGSPPASCLLPSSGQLVASIQLPPTWAEKAGMTTEGAVNLILPQATTALLSASPGYFRLFSYDRSICALQGTVGADPTTSPDLVITNANPVLGQIITLVGLTITAPGA